MATQSRDLEGKGAQRARRRKGTVSGREARHDYYSRDEPLFKGRFPRSRPEASRASLPRCTPEYPPYGMGAQPCMPYSWPAGAKKANRHARSVLQPRGRCVASSSPRPTVQPRAWGPGPHVRHLACRFLCVKKIDRRMRSTPPLAVARLFASAKSNSPV
jgi:hypothetical protein